jgi:hypothetical protein
MEARKSEDSAAANYAALKEVSLALARAIYKACKRNDHTIALKRDLRERLNKRSITIAEACFYIKIIDMMLTIQMFTKGEANFEARDVRNQLGVDALKLALSIAATAAIIAGSASGGILIAAGAAVGIGYSAGHAAAYWAHGVPRDRKLWRQYCVDLNMSAYEKQAHEVFAIERYKVAHPRLQYIREHRPAAIGTANHEMRYSDYVTNLMEIVEIDAVRTVPFFSCILESNGWKKPN